MNIQVLILALIIQKQIKANTQRLAFTEETLRFLGYFSWCADVSALGFDMWGRLKEGGKERAD